LLLYQQLFTHKVNVALVLHVQMATAVHSGDTVEQLILIVGLGVCVIVLMDHLVMAQLSLQA